MFMYLKNSISRSSSVMIKKINQVLSCLKKKCLVLYNDNTIFYIIIICIHTYYIFFNLEVYY